MNEQIKYTIGLDFGSLSCRGVLVDVSDGRIEAEASMEYPHGVMSEYLPDGTPLEGAPCLQSPKDFREAMISVVRELVGKCDDPARIVGISVDTTASTVLPLDGNFVPLCENEKFASRPHAWMKMWKHHGAAPQADRIMKVCLEQNRPYPDWYGGSISPECLISKVIEVFERDREVFDAAASFVEVMDYLTSLLTGKPTFSIPIAKAKAFYSVEDGYPDGEFFFEVNPEIHDLPAKLMEHYPDRVLAYPGERAGGLCAEMAKTLGLPEGIAVSVGTPDSYAPIMGLGITREAVMMMIIGTSTAMMIMSREPHSVEGVTACLRDIYYKDMWGYASGQSSTGDAFGWFAKNCVPACYEREADERGMSVQQLLTEKASLLPPGSCGVMALDWINGNKSCLANPYLSGLFLGMNLSTRAEHMYRALIEATAFGVRVIAETYKKSGVPIEEIRACGGIVGKNPLLVQIYADVLGVPIKASRCTQTPALGAAINAAAASGVYGYILEAVDAMSDKDFKIYHPNPESQKAYNELYDEYLTLHDYFGRGENRVMERLYGRR